MGAADLNDIRAVSFMSKNSPVVSMLSNLLLFCARGQRKTAGEKEGTVVRENQVQKEEKKGREHVIHLICCYPDAGLMR